jgi:solute carrier family 25 folate transporter 32
LQVLRTRLQKRQQEDTAQSQQGRGGSSSTRNSNGPRTTLVAFSNMVHREGLRGMYRGMVPNLMRTMPQSAITFMVYEKLLSVARNA